MRTAQVGIFALGTTAHCYLEFDARPGVTSHTVATAAAALTAPDAAPSGVNLVVGLRPELWATVAARDAPPVSGFNSAVRGPDGFSMPATQHDVFVWVAGAGPDVVFDASRVMLELLRPIARLVGEVTGWAYQHNRDLTGFIDGTENPAIVEAAEVAVVPDGQPGAGGSILLVQKWEHNDRWFSLQDDIQEQVIGRTKADSVELDDDRKPADSHISRTVVLDEQGAEQHIFRRNTAYGGVTQHGTMFIGFSTEQRRLARMLDRMAGFEGGVRDALTRYTSALTGAYYFCPAVEALQALRAPDGTQNVAGRSQLSTAPR